MVEKNGATRPAGDSAPPDASQQTVWQHEDPAIRRLGDNPPGSHWSQQSTQPLSPRWSPARRRQLVAKQAALIAGHERRALGLGAGMGALLAVTALALALLVAAASGWLPGNTPPSSDSAQPPVPAQPARHTVNPAATNIPTSTALPTTTAQPTATTWPTATDEPTATVQPTATVAPQPTLPGQPQGP
ncbi:MAG TPA: hypothetical protein VFS83_01520 [Ktedonobacterales bacterium]|nr:hypothetical protein [Ktedonobacterales bacterium]